MNRALWRGIAALNASSALAQVAQYGIAFALYPLALQAHGLPAWRVGLGGSAAAAGMFAGLLVAPRCLQRCGHRGTVLLGLASSGAALLATPALPIASWPALAALTGFGLGLRWIGLETWLYRIAPEALRGRIVGVHETLIGIADVVGPALIALLGADTPAPFLAAGGVAALAALPLAGTGAVAVAPLAATPRSDDGAPRSGRAGSIPGRDAATRFAAIGGLLGGAALGVFPAYAAARGLGLTQATTLLTVFGLGAMLLQFPLGWLADTAGRRSAASATTVATLAAALLAGLAPGDGLAFAALMFVLGGAVTGHLTLALIAATQGGDAARISAGVTRVSIVYTAGSALGPLAAGALASAAGGETLMGFLAAVATLLPLATLAAARQRAGRA